MVWEYICYHGILGHLGVEWWHVFNKEGQAVNQIVLPFPWIDYLESSSENESWKWRRIQGNFTGFIDCSK